MIRLKRKFDSFKWLSLPRFSTILGIGWSTCWRRWRPLTVDGKNLPYFGVTLINKSDISKCQGITIGPVIIFYGKLINLKL